MSDDTFRDVLTRRPESGRKSQWDLPDESMLPNPSRGYEPFARAAVTPVYTLHCVLGVDGYWSGQYCHLDSGSRLSVDGKGQVITLRFCGSKTTRVTIRGRNLWRLHDLIHQHRMPWIMQVDRGRDFVADNEPVITVIEIEEVP